MQNVRNAQRTQRLMFRVLPAALALALATTAHAQSSQDTSNDNASVPCKTTTADGKPCKRSTDITQLDTVQVNGVRGSIADAIAIKQSSPLIVDSIVAEDVGKLPDNSVAAALQRVTGVQVARGGGEVNTVLIRGLPDVVTTFSGRNIFTTTGRSIALADIPADLVQRVDVYKTNDARSIEGGIGGLIDVRLRRPFDFKDDWTLAGTANGIYSRNAGHTDPFGSITANKIWHTDAGKFGVMAAASYQKQRYEESSTFNFISDLRDNPMGTGGKVYIPETIGSIYNLGDRTRRSANFTVQWAPNDKTDIYFENFYVGYRNTYNNPFWIPLPVIANGSNVTSLTTKPGTNVVQSLTADNMFTLTSNQAFQSSSDTYQSALGGSWKGERVTLSTDLAYTYSKASTRDFILDTGFIAPRIAMNFDNGGATSAMVTNADGSAFNLANPSNYFLNQYYDQWNHQTGKDWSWKNDATIKLDAGPINAIDVGLRASWRTATNIAADTGGRPNISGTTAFMSSFPGMASLTPSNLLNGALNTSPNQWMLANPNYLLTHSAQIRVAMGYSPSAPLANPALYFNDKEDTYALYAQARYGFNLGDVPVDGGFGVRRVRLNSTLQGTEILGTEQTPVTINKSSDVWLPSFSANFNLRDDLILRAAYGKTITRPAFAALNPQLSLYQATATIPASGSGGNPNLNPVRSSNTDLSLEWYFHPASLLSAALFHRDINGYIQTYADSEVVDGVSYLVSRPRNTGNGTLEGAELAYTQFYDFLPGWLSGFGTQLNATFINANTQSPTGQRQDLVNVSKRAYNAILIYQKGPYSARLAYNWRSRYAVAYNPGGAQPQSIYNAPVDDLDFAVNYDVNKHLTLTLEGTNLMGRVVHTQFGNSQYLFPRDAIMMERTFMFGARFRL